MNILGLSIRSLIVVLVFSQCATETRVPPAKIGQYLHVQQDSNRIYIYGGNLTLIVDRHPWRLSIHDNFTSQVYLQEATDDSMRLGFGRWEGKYLDIYQGYLFRIGEIVEWNHATDAAIYNVTKDANGNGIIAATLKVASNSSSSSSPMMLVTFTEFDERVFTMKVQVSSSSDKYNRVGWGYLTPNKNESFFGFGERFNAVNQRGHKVGSWLEEGNWGLGRFDPTGKIRVPKGELATYFPMPLFISSKGYGMQLNMFHRSVFDSKTSDQHMHILVETDSMDLTIFCKNAVQDTFHKMSEKNGKSLIPPLWAFGPWNQVGDEVSGVSIVNRTKEMIFKEDIPFSQCINTVHYFPEGGGRDNHQQLKDQNKELAAMGIKSTAYFNAMVSQKWASAYDYAANAGFFFKTKDGRPYNYSYLATSDFQVSQMDFTNPKAVAWYQQQLDVAIEAGFKGWMYDFGEYTPHDSVTYDGHDGLYMHNKFPLQYQAACSQHLISKYGNYSSDYAPDFVFYVRSGYLGSQKETWAHWTGDPSSDWNKASGLPAQLVAMLNIGISGIPYTGSDIGGFSWYVDPPPTMELWVRWTQLGCFSGLMHEQGSGTGFGQKTHIFDTKEGTRIWRKFAKLRTQLALYLYNAAHQARSSGMPIMRHHILAHPRDPKAIEQEYQYMFGDSILVAPVVEKGATKWTVYLPVVEDLGNNWIEFFASYKYNETDGSFRIGFKEYLKGGTTVEVDAPLDEIPIFVRAGDIIILTDPRVQTLSSASNPDVRTFQSMKNIRHVWAWPMKWNDFIGNGELYDGSLYVLYYGKFTGCICEFLAWKIPKNITHVVQISGPWIETPNGVQTSIDGKVKLPKASSVDDLLSRVDDPTISEWFFDPEMGTMWIKMAPDVFDVYVMGDSIV